ncbi:MAG: hypothetical protein WBA81_22975 [Rhodococcus sp. (in: high G+C Gram-positive bacteria)]|jgi:hypothetical protein
MEFTQSTATLIVGLVAAATTAAVAIFTSLKNGRDDRENILRDYEIYKNLISVSENSAAGSDSNNIGAHGELNEYVRRLMELNSANRLLGLSIEELPSRFVRKGLIFIYPGFIVFAMLLYLVMDGRWLGWLIFGGFLVSILSIGFGLKSVRDGARKLRQNRLLHYGAIEQLHLMYIDLGISQQFELNLTEDGIALHRKGNSSVKIKSAELRGRNARLTDESVHSSWVSLLVGSTVSKESPILLPNMRLQEDEIAILELGYTATTFMSRRQKSCVLQLRGPIDH